MAPSCKLKLARFSAWPRIQDGARVATIKGGKHNAKTGGGNKSVFIKTCLKQYNIYLNWTELKRWRTKSATLMSFPHSASSPSGSGPTLNCPASITKVFFESKPCLGLSLLFFHFVEFPRLLFPVWPEYNAAYVVASWPPKQCLTAASITCANIGCCMGIDISLHKAASVYVCHNLWPKFPSTIIFPE